MNIQLPVERSHLRTWNLFSFLGSTGRHRRGHQKAESKDTHHLCYHEKYLESKEHHYTNQTRLSNPALIKRYPETDTVMDWSHFTEAFLYHNQVSFGLESSGRSKEGSSMEHLETFARSRA